MIREFQTKATDILTASAGVFKTAMDALQTAHGELTTEISTLGASMDAQMRSRMESTLDRHRDLLAHFSGKVLVKEPVIRFTAPRPDMPHVADAPAGFAEQPHGSFPNGEAADAEGGQP